MQQALAAAIATRKHTYVVGSLLRNQISDACIFQKNKNSDACMHAYVNGGAIWRTYGPIATRQATSVLVLDSMYVTVLADRIRWPGGSSWPSARSLRFRGV
jgi:hypothetical protein